MPPPKQSLQFYEGIGNFVDYIWTYYAADANCWTSGELTAMAAPLVLSAGAYGVYKAERVFGKMAGRFKKVFTKGEDVIDFFKAGKKLEYNDFDEPVKQVIKKSEVDDIEDLYQELDDGSYSKIPYLDEPLDKTLLNNALQFDDNIIDVAETGKNNWKTFQNNTFGQLVANNPGKRVGSQITLDVTLVTKEGQSITKTIIPDALVQTVQDNGRISYKVIDAKTSVKKDLVNMDDLTSTCTANQKLVYPAIDGLEGTITKVEMRGGQAEQAFDIKGSTIVNLESGVEFYINSSKTDFTKYVPRPRKK